MTLRGKELERDSAMTEADVASLADQAEALAKRWGLDKGRHQRKFGNATLKGW